MADPNSIYAGYLKASRFSRIKDADLTRALKPYELDLASARKNRQSDAQLRHVAASAVLKRYLKQKKPRINVGGKNTKDPTGRKSNAPATVPLAKRYRTF